MRPLRWMMIAVVAGLVGCVQQPPQDDSLYQALGERPGIQRIVEGMLLHIAKDPRIVEYFRKVDIVRVRDKLVEKFCEEAGGPCRYAGDSLAEVLIVGILGRGEVRRHERCRGAVDDYQIGVVPIGFNVILNLRT